MIDTKSVKKRQNLHDKIAEQIARQKAIDFAERKERNRRRYERRMRAIYPNWGLGHWP